MALDLSAIGRSTGVKPVSWTSKDAIIYALGVGAGQQDPAQELAFTTENTGGVEQQVLPTFALVLGHETRAPSYGEFDRKMSVHAEQGVVQHQPLKPDGSGFIERVITGIYDKGSGALVTWATRITDQDGKLLVEGATGSFIRGGGGFGGDRGPKSTYVPPERTPDLTIEQPIPIDQALLYRLSGDRNPLHSDPAFAKGGGWPRPILHGMCTYGYVARAILGLVDNDPARFRSMKVRFSSPVLPGDTLVTSIWRDGGAVSFRTAVGDRLVLDGGQAELDA